MPASSSLPPSLIVVIAVGDIFALESSRIMSISREEYQMNCLTEQEVLDNHMSASSDMRSPSPQGTVSTQDSEESIQQRITFTCLGSCVTIVGHIRQDGSISKMEAVLSMGNINIALEYELGQRLAVILELDYLNGGAVKIVGGEIRLSIGLLRVNYRFTV
ncbi:hypothetical protein IW262DRAFT_1459333 [Armillaria fumosa]|nr:hypothetical protein IW262DRAFT_1459333 [Armillaria fumosa]